jgi:hypothetical protein
MNIFQKVNSCDIVSSNNNILLTYYSGYRLYKNTKNLADNMYYYLKKENMYDEKYNNTVNNLSRKKKFLNFRLFLKN